MKTYIAKLDVRAVIVAADEAPYNPFPMLSKV